MRFIREMIARKAAGEDQSHTALDATDDEATGAPTGNSPADLSDTGHPARTDFEPTADAADAPAGDPLPDDGYDEDAELEALDASLPAFDDEPATEEEATPTDRTMFDDIPEYAPDEPMPTLSAEDVERAMKLRKRIWHSLPEDDLDFMSRNPEEDSMVTRPIRRKATLTGMADEDAGAGLHVVHSSSDIERELAAQELPVREHDAEAEPAPAPTTRGLFARFRSAPAAGPEADNREEAPAGAEAATDDVTEAEASKHLGAPEDDEVQAEVAEEADEVALSTDEAEETVPDIAAKEEAVAAEQGTTEIAFDGDGTEEVVLQAEETEEVALEGQETVEVALEPEETAEVAHDGEGAEEPVLDGEELSEIALDAEEDQDVARDAEEDEAVALDAEEDGDFELDAEVADEVALDGGSPEKPVHETDEAEEATQEGEAPSALDEPVFDEVAASANDSEAREIAAQRLAQLRMARSPRPEPEEATDAPVAAADEPPADFAGSEVNIQALMARAALEAAAQPARARTAEPAEPVAQVVASARGGPGDASGAEDGPVTQRGRRGGRIKTRLLGFQPDQGTGDVMQNIAEREDGGAHQMFPVGWIVVVEGPGRGSAFSLHGGVSLIGRGEDQAVRLNFGDTSISRNNHASVAFDDETGSFYLGHGGKSNIVRLNGKPVLSTEELSHGDEIRIGETTLRFASLCSADFTWAENAGDGAGNAAIA